MSQVGIPRPVFGGQGPQKSGITLPQIQHPLSRMENPGNMDIRGVSRASDRPGSQPNFGRPLANENAYPVRKSLSAMDRESRRSSRLAMSFPQPNHAQAIPEGVEVTYGDPDKTRLPVFGNRAEVASRNDMNSRMSSRLSSYSTKARLEVDELEAKLRQKVMGCFYEVKKKFKDNDPEQKGNVSREALHRILVVLLGQEISQPVFIRLLERLGFGDKGIINYAELFAYFRQMPDDYPSWMDPVQRQWQEKAVMSAAQVHAQLREKAKQRIVDIADLIPQINPGGSNRILKHEFKQMLNKLAFYMEDTEFEKLWKRYDPKNTGTINGEQFMNNLGIFMGRNGSGVPGQRLSPLPEGASPGRSLKRKEVERKQSLDIERWLKTKFREGCANMRESFLAKDAKNSGLVGFDDFLEVLCQYGLHLEKKLLAAFLNRCGVTAKPQGVPYLEFLHRFQDRSEDGMTHNILTNSKHRVNQRPKSPGNISTMSGIEVQIMNMFQRDFLALLGTFKQLDKLGLNVLSQEEFRAAMESRFSLNLTDAQWNTFVDRLPLDEDGNVQYASFMKQFDSKGLAPSLFDKPPNAGSQPQPAPAAPKAAAPAPAVRNAPSPLPAVPEDMEVELPVMEDDEDGEDFGFRRSVPELFKVIKDLLTRRYQDVERKYNEIDEINTRRLSQDDMYNLLKCFDVHPEISRGEIRDLWSTFILNSDRTLEWLQFVRHFGFSPKSAAFPNAKVNPPRRGDADFMLRSKKLNSAADMLMDSLRSKVDYMWEELRKEFVAMDPYNTRFVSREEFKDVLTELCVHLSDYEVNLLCDKFDISKDGRVSYYEFLKPFALKKQIWRHGNNMLSLLQHPQPELPIPDIVEPPQKGLHGITAKLRQKLAGDWKNLRRAFKKLDKKNDGYLSLPEFRSVLKLANVILDEDEVYHVMTQFDNKMTGKIPYEKFIEETFKPPSRHSVKKLKA